MVAGTSFLLATNFAITIDKSTVHWWSTHINSPFLALQVMFASYYVLNIAYPLEAAATREFMQIEVLYIIGKNYRPTCIDPVTFMCPNSFI